MLIPLVSDRRFVELSSYVLLPFAVIACSDAPRTTDSDAASSDFCSQATAAVAEHQIQAWATSSREPTDRQIVVGANAEIPNGMNSAVASDYFAVQHQQFVNLMTLVQYDEHLNAVPYLAESWEIEPDGTSVTFHLRDDVKWHDGQPTDAHDVAFTFRLVTHPETGFPNGAFWAAYTPGEAGVEVVDDYTVRFPIQPHAQPLDTWRAVAILPEHLLGDVPPAGMLGHPYGSQCPVGNGPFVFKEHLDGQRWVFEANPEFPESLGGPSSIDRYIYRVAPDANTLLLELLSGAIDIYVNAPPSQAQQIANEASVELRAFPFRSVVFAAWNGRVPALSDPRVRMALTRGTDRNAIVSSVLEGYGTVADGTVPPFHWAYAEATDHGSYDPAAARRLLSDAGYEDRDDDGVREGLDGTRLSIELLTNEGSATFTPAALAMQAQLRDVGVELNVQSLEWNTIISRVTDAENRDFEGAVLQWVAEFKPDDSDLFSSSSADATYGFSGTANVRMDALLRQLKEVIEREEAEPLWREYQTLLRQEHPYTFLYFPDRLAAVNRRVRNATMDARGEWLNARGWEVRDPN